MGYRSPAVVPDEGVVRFRVGNATVSWAIFCLPFFALSGSFVSKWLRLDALALKFVLLCFVLWFLAFLVSVYPLVARIEVGQRRIVLSVFGRKRAIDLSDVKMASVYRELRGSRRPRVHVWISMRDDATVEIPMGDEASFSKHAEAIVEAINEKLPKHVRSAQSDGS